MPGLVDPILECTALVDRRDLRLEGDAVLFKSGFFIPGELLVGRVLTYERVSEVFVALQKHNVWKVEVDGPAPMTAEEFTKYR